MGKVDVLDNFFSHPARDHNTVSHKNDSILPESGSGRTVDPVENLGAAEENVKQTGSGRRSSGSYSSSDSTGINLLSGHWKVKYRYCIVRF